MVQACRSTPTASFAGQHACAVVPDSHTSEPAKPAAVASPPAAAAAAKAAHRLRLYVSQQRSAGVWQRDFCATVPADIAHSRVSGTAAASRVLARCQRKPEPCKRTQNPHST